MRVHQTVATRVETCLKGTAALVLLVAAGAVEAQTKCFSNCVHGEDNYPWWKQGWHKYERSKAYNIAFNKAVVECNYNELVLDQKSISVQYGWVNIDGGQHSANIAYYCKDKPPRIATRPIDDVWGPYNCDAGSALKKAESAAAGQCLLINPAGEWYLHSYDITGVNQIGSGECGFGSWGPNPQYRYKLLPTCGFEY